MITQTYSISEIQYLSEDYVPKYLSSLNRVIYTLLFLYKVTLLIQEHSTRGISESAQKLIQSSISVNTKGRYAQAL